MRILLSAQQAQRRHAVPGYAFWETYFKNGLAEAGHEIVEVPGVDWAEGLVPLDRAARARWLAGTWGRTVEFIRAEHARRPVDLFLGYLFPDQVEPRAVGEIRRIGVPCVNFFCDNVREFVRVPASFRAFDLHWVPEADARALYTAARLPFIYAPMPMWVPRELRNLPGVENEQVVFIGSHDVLREELLGEAVARGLPLRLHGDGWIPGSEISPPPRRSWSRTLANQTRFLRTHGWRGMAMRLTYQRRDRRDPAWIAPRWHPAVLGADYFQALRESSVVLGINRYPSFRHSFAQPGRYSRLRDIEAPMLGACYLTEWAPGLEDLYEPGKEIAVYRDAAQLVEQVGRLRADASGRALLRRNGQRRALADHTIGRTLARIATHLGLTGTAT